MSVDTRIGIALATVISNVETPSVPLQSILQKVQQPPVQHARPASRFVRLGLATAASAAIFVVALPAISPAVVTSLEERYREALHALGGEAPPPAPAGFSAKLVTKEATLATAQARVPFTIVPPAGLPNDVTSSSIVTAPTGLYSRKTHAWHVGQDAVTFLYQRSGGHSFTLRADKYDPQEGAPSKYIFIAMNPAPDGKPVLFKHESYSWRNGDQVMSAIADENLTATEIGRIRSAMNGTPMATRAPHVPAPGDANAKMFRIVRP